MTAPWFLISLLLFETALGPIRSTPLSAQRVTALRLGVEAAAPAPRGDPDPLAGFVPESRTFWKEGGIVVGSLTALIGLAFLFDAGESGEGAGPWYAAPPAAALGFLIGFSPGALLGSLIPKGSPE